CEFIVTTDELLHKTTVQTICTTCTLYYILFVLYGLSDEPRRGLAVGQVSTCHSLPGHDRHGVNTPRTLRTRDKEAPDEAHHLRGDRRHRRPGLDHRAAAPADQQACHWQVPNGLRAESPSRTLRLPRRRRPLHAQHPGSTW